MRPGMSFETALERPKCGNSSKITVRERRNALRFLIGRNSLV